MDPISVEGAGSLPASSTPISRMGPWWVAMDFNFLSKIRMAKSAKAERIMLIWVELQIWPKLPDRASRTAISEREQRTLMGWIWRARVSLCVWSRIKMPSSEPQGLAQAKSAHFTRHPAVGLLCTLKTHSQVLVKIWIQDQITTRGIPCLKVMGLSRTTAQMSLPAVDSSSLIKWIKTANLLASRAIFTCWGNPERRSAMKILRMCQSKSLALNLRKLGIAWMLVHKAVEATPGATGLQCKGPVSLVYLHQAVPWKEKAWKEWGRQAIKEAIQTCMQSANFQWSLRATTAKATGMSAKTG